MSNPNRILLHFVFFLVSASVFSPTWVASGSPTEEPNFKRPDPLCHFHYYNGGYDVRSKHYWVVSSNASFSRYNQHRLPYFVVFSRTGDRTHLYNISEQGSHFSQTKNRYKIQWYLDVHFLERMLIVKKKI